MFLMSLSCMELQLEQWSHSKGKNGMCQTDRFTLVFLYEITILVGFFLNNHIGIFLTFSFCKGSPRKCSGGQSSVVCEAEFPGQHFEGDLLQLALGSSQRYLFEDNWRAVVVRVYWLKARFLALQVTLTFIL